MKKILAVMVCIAMLCSGMTAFAEPETVTAHVLEIEKYGHALLDITIEDFEKAGFTLGDVVTVSAGSFQGDMPYFNGYYVDRGETMMRAYPGQTNIAVCINYGKFNEVAGIDTGDEVIITMKEKAGQLSLQEINNLVYTSDRTDYASDEIFANFRPIVMGDIAEGNLYRSASPVNPIYGRSDYACALMEEAGVSSIMNLANTQEELEGYFTAEDFDEFAYKDLYEQGKVITLGLPADFASDDFIAGIVKGLTFLSENDPPYLVHCTEGKDRAGFASMILEALSGASEQEIIEDYMLSFVNYYGVEPGTEKYNLIVEKNLNEMLKDVAGEDRSDLRSAAESFLISHGMTEKALATLQAKLAS